MTALRAALNFARSQRAVTSDMAWLYALRPIKNADGKRDAYLDRTQRLALINKAGADVATLLRGMSLVPIRPVAVAAVEVTFDPAKNDKNFRERGLPFERYGEFDFLTAVFSVDTRREYGEVRRRLLGLLDGRVHALVFVETSKGFRVTSFRRANSREVRNYGQASKT